MRASIAIVAERNGEALANTIADIQAQDLRALEIIVVCNAPAIQAEARRMVKLDPRVTVLTDRADPWRRAAQAVSGDYFGWTPAGPRFAPGAVRTALEALTSGTTPSAPFSLAPRTQFDASEAAIAEAREGANNLGAAPGFGAKIWRAVFGEQQTAARR